MRLIYEQYSWTGGHKWYWEDEYNDTISSKGFKSQGCALEYGLEKGYITEIPTYPKFISRLYHFTDDYSKG